MWGTRRFLDAEVEDWHIECWAWLLRHLGGLDAVRARRLALPTGEFFPQVQGEPHARALDVFARVKELMGMGEDWPCTLIPRERTTGAVGEFAVLKAAKGVAGTFFQTSSGDIVITYDRALVERPSNLIATFAHELSHYALKDIAEPPPGAEVEPMLRELATDLAAAFHVGSSRWRYSWHCGKNPLMPQSVGLSPTSPRNWTLRVSA
jgi:hypothetical protein